MANRNIDESIRKPRRTRGTPFHYQRNLISIGILAAGGLCWYLYELWPQSQKLKTKFLEGNFAPSLDRKTRTLEAELLTKKPGYLELQTKLQARAEARENELYVDESKPQPWYVKAFAGSENSNDSSDSPYKNCQKEVKGVSLNSSQSDSDDFKTPKAINKVSKILSKPPTRNENRKRTRQPQLRKFVEDNLRYTDVHPEHLQMALALSESSYEAENPDEIPTSQEKKEHFKAAFEKFGFGYSKKRLNVENKRDSNSKKSNKKSRWRYVTPFLKTRTKEEREALISSKVSLILAQNGRKSIPDHTHDTFELYCDLLNKHAHCKIFEINCLGLDQLNEPDLFYVGGLGLEASSASCGRLLKDWRRIPGREATPERDGTNQSVPRDMTPPTLPSSSPSSNENSNQNSAFGVWDSQTPPSWHGSSNQIGARDGLVINNSSESVNWSPQVDTSIKKNDASANESDNTIIATSNSLTPPYGNKNSNMIGAFDHIAPPTLSYSETSTNESKIVAKRSSLSPPPHNASPPIISDSEASTNESVVVTKRSSFSPSPHNASPPIISDSEASTNERTVVAKRSSVSPPPHDASTPILNEFGRTVRIAQESDEGSSDCYIVEPPEMNFSTKKIPPKCEEIAELACRETKDAQHSFPVSKYRLTPLSETSYFEPIAVESRQITPPRRLSFDDVTSSNDSAKIICGFTNQSLTRPASDSTIVEVLDSLTPPTVHESSNQTTIIGTFDDLFPPIVNVSETLTNENATVAKLQGVSPPSDESASPTFKKFEMVGRISQMSDETSSDCYVVESAETKNSQRFDAKKKISKYRSTPPLLERSRSEPMIVQDLKMTPPRHRSFGGHTSSGESAKRLHTCISPDLFGSDDEQPFNKILSPEMNRLKGGQSLLVEETQCFDLTNSDEEEKSFHLKMSDPEDSIGRRSDLNVTEYVQNLLNKHKEDRKLEKISTSEDDSQKSQDSIVVSDEELNYSSVFGTPQLKRKVEYNFSDDEDFALSLAQRIERNKDGTLQETRRVSSQSSNPRAIHSSDIVGCEPFQETASAVASTSRVSQSSSSKLSQKYNPNLASKKAPSIFNDSLNDVLEQIPTATPPTSSSLFIKTNNVTPMANFDEMDTPKISKELDRFGLKPLKRKKGAKLLKYLYESTHPVVGNENRPPVKKRRTQEVQPVDIVGGVGEEEDIILEKKQLKRVASCAVPLHIVWHNFVMSNPKIRENILLYEPVQLEVLHSMIKDQGFRFNIKDLLSFLDKKCVTVRTGQGSHRKRK